MSVPPSSLKETRVDTMKETLLLMQETHFFIWNTNFQNTTCWTERAGKMGTIENLISWKLAQVLCIRIHRTLYQLVWRCWILEDPIILMASYNALFSNSLQNQAGPISLSYGNLELKYRSSGTCLLEARIVKWCKARPRWSCLIKLWKRENEAEPQRSRDKTLKKMGSNLRSWFPLLVPPFGDL